jgi:filamin
MKGGIEVTIEGPNHYTKNHAEKQPDGAYLLKYVPLESGLFKIQVKWNQKDVPTSPYVVNVINPEKVRVVGGWNNLLDLHNILNLKHLEEKSITFDVSEAGPGTMTCVITAPNGSKLPCTLEQNKPSRTYTLSFNPLFEGEYKIQVYWDHHPIANMPVVARTFKPVDMSKVRVHGTGLADAKIGKECEFIIDGSNAGDLTGLPDVKMTGTWYDIEVRVVHMGNNVYKCSYVPQSPGTYLISCKWNETESIGDSPYKVIVGMTTDPAKVAITGEGTRTGVFGQEIKALIDTRRAGPGELTAYCMGPHKVAYCEFFDHKDGTFTLYVKPQEPGKHTLQVKYNDEHVPGSPFVIRVAGPPDANKVRVFGPGICHGVLNKFESRFICETKEAGAGQLSVKVRGPKGAFRVEMQRKNQKDRTIYCDFDPTEPGQYQICVRWAGVNVPGSPFNVNVFRSQEELERFIKMNP